MMERVVVGDQLSRDDAPIAIFAGLVALHLYGPYRSRFHAKAEVPVTPLAARVQGVSSKRRQPDCAFADSAGRSSARPVISSFW
jgi:hypothetical protein